MESFIFFKTTMPNSRQADYYLGCLDSSVFIDFDLDEDQRIYLKRISFDRYGCCELDGLSIALDIEDSNKFVYEMGKESLDQETIAYLVKKIIFLNRGKIWNDALTEYNLI